MDFIVEILIVIKRFILVYICAVFGLMMGYFLFIGNLEIGMDDVKVSYKKAPDFQDPVTNSSW